jgi:hypothetical protein
MAGSFGVWLSVTPCVRLRLLCYTGSFVWGSGGEDTGTDAVMNSDTIIAMSGLMALAAAALTGAMWGTPLVMASFRWFLD